MITGGVNPYTTRLRLKLYRVANYNGLNPKRCWTKCPWRGVVHPVACHSRCPVVGMSSSLAGVLSCQCQCLACSLMGRPQVSVGWLAGVLLGPELLVQGNWCLHDLGDSCHPGVPWECLPVLENRAFLRPGMWARLGGVPPHTWISQIVRGANYSNFPICSWRRLLVDTIISHFARGFAYYLLSL